MRTFDLRFRQRRYQEMDSWMRNRVCPGSVSTKIWPLCCWTMIRTIPACGWRDRCVRGG